MGTNKSAKQKRLEKFIITHKERKNQLPSFLKEDSNPISIQINSFENKNSDLLDQSKPSALFNQLIEDQIVQPVLSDSLPKKKKNKKRKKTSNPSSENHTLVQDDSQKLAIDSKQKIKDSSANVLISKSIASSSITESKNTIESVEIKTPIIKRRKRVKINRVLDKIGWENKRDSDLENFFSDDLYSSSEDHSEEVSPDNNNFDIRNSIKLNSLTSTADLSKTITSNNYEDFSESVKLPEVSTLSKKTRNASTSIGGVNKKEDSTPTVYTGSKLKMHLIKQGVKPKYINVVRKSGIEEQRLKLPILAEEQPIMEAIKENPVIILCGSTGSGKTTQLPQFLYEAGYAGFPNNSNHISPNNIGEEDESGIIGITQPRRVAAVSMAKRVAYELNTDAEPLTDNSQGSSIVSYQVRFDNKSSKSTKIKFMTDGVLLREMCEDFLLSKYSVIILDEAHERSLNTDILVGSISRIVKLRQNMYLNKERMTIKDNLDKSIVSNKLVKPLRLIIMSATLMIDEFSKNLRLFNPSPKVMKVESRQYPVCIRFNRFTPVGESAYVNAAIKKTLQIHEKLPEGGILVFLTGQAEINYFCKEVVAQFNQKLSEIDKKELIQSKKNLNKIKRESNDTVSVDQGSVEVEDLEIGDTFDIDSITDSKNAVVSKKLNKYRKKVSKRDSNYEETLVENQIDDYDNTSDEDLDGEEEDDIWIFNNDKNSESIKNDLLTNEKKSDTMQKLYVLPLYATLEPAQQLLVFSPPPDNHRMIIVSTNVAETSITIPGIKYVVDSGKIKDKKYDIGSGTIRYQVDWTSQASADQRAGRAGRTGIGYCYRLYSSNVFTQFFPKFNQPEISKLPIEQVVLLMKFNYINNIESFPFVTPPHKDSILKATHLLEHLGAIEVNNGSITDLGRTMMLFPVSPRYAKMLILGNKHDLLLHVISIISVLTIGNPFKNELDIDKLNSEQKLKNPNGIVDPVTGEDLSMKKKYYKAMNTLARQNPTSDVLKWLSVMGAYEYVDSPLIKEKVCDDLFLRQKLMSDSHKLYRQLLNICKQHLPIKNLSENTKLEPPTPQQTTILRQIICNGFVDQIAIRSDLANANNNNTDINGDDDCDGMVPYTTMGSSEKAFIHPSSVLLINKPMSKSGKNKKSNLYHHYPKYIVYGELQKTTRLWMKQLTEINPNWLVLLAKTFVTFGKPLQQPAPVYDADKTSMTCFVSASFGPKSWPLPNAKVEQKRVGTRWILSKVLN
ncbi:putative ATP-dependent RNA helicase DHX37 [Smittium mucronatum]|uniref:RNA helicase n=1 Tax=Smittium mucronatum TaxID=133383 RepID=A0A1R0GWR9_9FUNG|nr:putative ATP-dependent RNA helicase DHX37 [Smittium mucronatum]